MILLDIYTFLGRIHPLFIHLPIGFILLAIIFDGVSYHKKFGYLRDAVSFTLLLGFASAVMSCLLGFVLSMSGDYDTLSLSNHRLAGILLTLLTGVLYGMTTPIFRSIIPGVPRRIFSALSILTLLLVAYTGHQGAVLTHGDDYITWETLLHREREKPARAEEAMIFEDVVQPILDQRCKQCHQRSKRKGQLSIESLASILKGGKHGPAVVPGDISESELFQRITLDPSHEEFMPSEGKAPLTKTETEVIRWWIEKGMAVDKKKIVEIRDYQQISSLVGSLLKLDGHSVEEANFSDQLLNANIPSTIDMTLVKNLRKKGLVVRVMFQNPVMLDVTLPPRSGKKMEDILPDLRAVSKNIVWLNLSDNNFSGNDLEIISDMSNVQKLRLEKNPVSDAIVDHLEGLEYLEAVNLNETNISEVGAEKLRRNPSIKRIYTWKTKVKPNI
ncbi:MAG TPA: c-type cytochrome domain-containing protein [Chryseosolibacter sp.]|nr:c-type cytochrome domain-containing protein [Chryseosolibacter sp.]